MSISKLYYVYIMASGKNGTIYVGFTDDIERRVYEHKNAIFADCFTARYKIFNLVYYEEYLDRNAALRREANMKAWQRGWKMKLIEGMNPNWNDLYQNFIF